jgi:serine/threonine-protein kinase
VLAENRETIGRYELLLELGRGGMAVLYLARARGVGGFARLFAIKRILPHLAADPVFVDMFLAEGRIAARLSHPNLCPVFELGQDRGELFLVMEYLDGVAWEALVAAAPRDPRGLALAAGVLAQACDGLHYAHTFRDADGTALPIVHRDVSPQNLFVSCDGTCRVLDFGVSKIATDPRRTASGVRKGKLPYMAPEQIRGEPVDARTDVWAVGVMLWEALVGRPLFDRETDFLTYQAITDGEVASVNVDGARYPAAADRVIARALAADRDRRYASARELGRDLVDLAGEVGGAASRDAIAEMLGQLCGDPLAARRRAIAAATVAPVADPDERDDRDAAATVSMAMRRDAIVVKHRKAQPRQRRWWIVGAIGAAAIAGSVAVAIAVRGGAPSAPSGAEAPRDVQTAQPASAPPPAASPPPASPPPAPPAPASTARTASASPPAPRTPPRDRRARDAAAPPAITATGWYAVDSAPYATIFIDDRKIGDTPLDRIALPAGSHRVRAVLADGRQRTFAIDIAPDHKTSSGTLAW